MLGNLDDAIGYFAMLVIASIVGIKHPGRFDEKRP
tara:strand:- start:996 stop:1100 length:105 start_codon:yes stop_codon:yes gene_type:complete